MKRYELQIIIGILSFISFYTGHFMNDFVGVYKNIYFFGLDIANLGADIFIVLALILQIMLILLIIRGEFHDKTEA